MMYAKLSTVLLLSVVSGGCWMGKKKVAIPLPLPAQPALLKPGPVLPAPPDIVIPSPTPAEAPVLAAKPSGDETPKADVTDPHPVATIPPRRTRPVTPKPATAAPEATESAATPTAASPPLQLREILTAEQQRQYEAGLTQSTRNAAAALSKVAGHTLTLAQQEYVSRIRTFLAQAQQAKADDLGTALQLARRADLLAQDLLKSLP